MYPAPALRRGPIPRRSTGTGVQKNQYSKRSPGSGGVVDGATR